MREPPSIAADALRTCLRAAYGVEANDIAYIPMGKDFEAAVYRVTRTAGSALFLKLSTRPLDAASYLVPRYLRDLGIAAVVAPLPTRDGLLWARLGEWLVLLYPFVEGETGWATMTRAAWRATGAIFRAIHDAPLPPAERVTLRRETFDPSAYAAEIARLEAMCLAPAPTPEPSVGPAERALRDCWRARQATIATGIASLRTLGAHLQTCELPQVICHADLHPGNLLRDAAGGVHVVDWDEVTLAPRERDFIFIRELRAVGAEAFWEGYGPAKIDWAALTYFLWERAVQDIIACARTVLQRDDLSEETRLDEARLLASLFGPENTVAAAFEAASHLPATLDVPTRPPSS